MSFFRRKPLYKHIASDACRCCNVPIGTANNIDHLASARWIVFSDITSPKGTRTITLVQGCDVCADMDIALKEADAEQRRYTKVSTFNQGCDHGARCPCGAVSYGMYAHCIKCSRANRMLDKIQAESRELENLLKNLRKQAKEQLKEEHGR